MEIDSARIWRRFPHRFKPARLVQSHPVGRDVFGDGMAWSGIFSATANSVSALRVSSSLFDRIISYLNSEACDFAAKRRPGSTVRLPSWWTLGRARPTCCSKQPGRTRHPRRPTTAPCPHLGRCRSHTTNCPICTSSRAPTMTDHALSACNRLFCDKKKLKMWLHFDNVHVGASHCWWYYFYCIFALDNFFNKLIIYLIYVKEVCSHSVPKYKKASISSQKHWMNWKKSCL